MQFLHNQLHGVILETRKVDVFSISRSGQNDWGSAWGEFSSFHFNPNHIFGYLHHSTPLFIPKVRSHNDFKIFCIVADIDSDHQYCYNDRSCKGTKLFGGVVTTEPECCAFAGAKSWGSTYKKTCLSCGQRKYST